MKQVSCSQEVSSASHVTVPAWTQPECPPAVNTGVSHAAAGHVPFSLPFFPFVHLVCDM